MSDAPIPDPSGELGFQMWRAAQALMRHLDAALRPLGLTRTQLVVLLTLIHLGRDGATVRISDVAAHESLDLNLVSQVLRRLEAAGFVARAPMPGDRRAVALRPTPAGATLAREGHAAMTGAQADFISHALDDGDAAALRRLCARLAS